MVTEEETRASVDAILSTWPRPTTPELATVIWKIEKNSRAWIVMYATRRLLETQSFTDLLVGICPFVVGKPTGGVHLNGSAPAEYKKYRSWLDQPE